MRTALIALTLMGAAVSSPARDREPRLTLNVSPAAALAPAAVTVRTTVETDADNRMLEIVVESPDYLRSSQIPLDGANAPRLNVVLLRGLPRGVYEVRATLVGVAGRRTSTLKLLTIAPSGPSR